MNKHKHDCLAPLWPTIRRGSILSGAKAAPAPATHAGAPALDTRGATLTGEVAKAVQPPSGTNQRQHSGAIRSCLLGLEKKGLVRRLDDEKPICWVKISN